MLNLPDVHAFDRHIPAGKMLVAEYGQIGAAERRASRVVIDTKTGWGRTTINLVASHAGWAIAGSMLRWDNGYFAVVWESDGSSHGSRYATFEDAQAHFSRIPA